MKVNGEQVSLGTDLVQTNRFRRSWGYLSMQALRVVATKVALLAANQRYPSLYVHCVRWSDETL